jgi:hypothetical protein
MLVDHKKWLVPVSLAGLLLALLGLAFTVPLPAAAKPAGGDNLFDKIDVGIRVGCSSSFGGKKFLKLKILMKKKL